MMFQTRLLFWFLSPLSQTVFSVNQGFYVTSPVQERRGCCYGETTFLHGDVVYSIPQICLQFVCNNAKIEPRFLKDPEKEGYSENIKCCEFDGKMYSNGTKLTSHCIPVVCANSSWVPLGYIDECCNHCYIHDDPHIYTFDGYQYDWHSTCNYSIAQSDSTYTPEVAVFSDFVPCYGGATCLSHSTFRNDPHTVVTLFNGAVFNILVNGHPFHVMPGTVQAVKSSSGVHPVLVWREPIDDEYANCIVLMGSSKLTVLHCPRRLDVWAHPAHTGSLDGLCGHFNFFVDDDFTSRDNHVHRLNTWPKAFPSSWRTDTQRDECRGPCYHCHEEITKSPCNVTDNEMDMYLYICTGKLNPLIQGRDELKTHIDTCAFDLCMITTNGGETAETESWLLFLVENLNTTIYILDKTEETKKSTGGHEG